MAIERILTMSRTAIMARRGLAELLVLFTLAGLPWLIVTLVRS